MTRPHLDIPPGIRAHMDYGKFVEAPPRMLVLQSDYWLDGACLRAAERMGWATECAPVRMEGRMPRDMVAGLLETLIAFRPDFVLSVNLSGMDEAGLLAGLFAGLRVPMATWFVDDPRTIIMGRTCYGGEYTTAITWERAYTGYLEAAGFGEVHTLPLAADTSYFDAPPGDAPRFPSTFVANSMRAFAAREWAWTNAHPELRGAVRTAFDDGRVNRQTFAGGPEAILGPGHARFDPDQLRHAEMLFFIEGTRQRREALVRALAPEGLEVRGDAAWSEVTAACGPYINYSEDLPGYYRHCAVNVNSTSIQMATTVNQRVFDCPAAGGFLLTDNQPALEDYFEPGSEVVTYGTLDEARDKLRFFRDHPENRIPIVEKARARVLAEHTYEHRLMALEHILKRRFG